jgi:2-polyprenyl-3-methyl-5-hydroxy-6-metoxy-1,4-benzoquinol methylase
MNQKVPLNQIYRQRRTFTDYPKIKETYDEITRVALEHGFHHDFGNGEIYPRGRRYDDAVLFNSDVDFNDKVVCELGARDGIFGAWLTKYVSKIYISDYFEEWGKGTKHDLGQIDYWKDIWIKVAQNPDRMVVQTEDMTKLSYPDNFFDIVVCTSVIEHLYNQENWQGDMIAMKEIVRICKPGGVILMSTDITSNDSKWVSGTFYYNEKDLFTRLITHSGCVLNGDHDFDFDNHENDAITDHNGFKPVSPVVFVLKKPNESKE